MSDSKWVRLLNALSEEDELILECLLKLVWTDDIRFFSIGDHSGYRWDYYSFAVEGMISGPPRGWYLYKEIEWIEFPPTVEVLTDTNHWNQGTTTHSHDLTRIRHVIEAAGKFDLESTEQGLRLYAYRRPEDG